MKLRWKKEADGELTLQFYTPNASPFEHWQDVPTFEPKETANIEQAIATERERCAKICEKTFTCYYYSAAGQELAIKIRNSK